MSTQHESAPHIPGRMRVLRSAARIGVLSATGLALLLLFVWLGRLLRAECGVPLPGPVIGLGLLAAVLVLAGRFRPNLERRLVKRLRPVSRVLLRHLGLLFVPAGVGIITEGPLLLREWLPILGGLLASTIAGLAATAWVMQRFNARGGQGEL